MPLLLATSFNSFNDRVHFYSIEKLVFSQSFASWMAASAD